MSVKLARADRRAAWMFMTPMLVAMLVVAVWPLARTFYFSFTDAYLDDPTNYSLIGFENYLEVIGDRTWWIAVRNTLIFTVVSVAIETVLGLGIALLINQA